MSCSCHAGHHNHDEGTQSCCEHNHDHDCMHDHDHNHAHECCCGCGHDHSHGEEENKIPRILASAILLAVAVILTKLVEMPLPLQLLAYLPAYLVAGYDVLHEAGESLIERKPFNESLLMAIATIGALLIGFIPGGSPEFAEAVFVMLFFQVGEAFEDAAQGKSRNAVSALVDIRPDVANLLVDGEIHEVHPARVHPGDTLIVRPGERVALDGVVVDGTSSLDTVALTGESVPRGIVAGDSVLSGCVNLSGVLHIRVTKEFDESTASRILDLVESASRGKSTSERFITRFARVYTPIVVGAAFVVAFVPPLLSGNFSANFATWLLRALTFLIVSCPCALVVSVPLSFFGGIGAASKKGVLIKGSNYLEALAQADTIVFDKTGTLTRGVFKVRVVHPENINPDELLHLAAHVERHSTHPIAAALREAYPNEKDDCVISNIQERAGEGIIAQVNNQTVAVGNNKLMDEVGAHWHECSLGGTTIHVAIDGTYAGHLVISDEVKPHAAHDLAALRKLGVRKTIMLSGDRADVAATVAKELGLDDYHANLLPDQKVVQVEELLTTTSDEKTLVFVGDGINDAPVLARADVGIAMGAMGSDAAIEAADVVLMDDSLSSIAQAIELSRRTVRIARQNIVFAIAIKLLILNLATLGLAPIWLAVFGDVGVMVLCVLNASRTLQVK
ncbi:heavy metal translocating P-type ATPase [Atopobium fossor]|uniref:heavy metal translocating P-type ATPase n=1 Tax=Atopobium fossor TaxID=39487 RepID=UPI000402B5C1|nr:heavy metal translocating P-type ATPase [Atopobium fossor]